MRTTKLYREIAASVSKDVQYPKNYSASPENALILLPEHHVQISSALNRHLRACRLTGNRIRMILNVFEQTIGYRKVEDDMNGGRLHQLLSVRADHSNQLVRDLYALNIILLKTGHYGFWMSLNYQFEHWGKPEFRHLATNDPRCLLSDYYQNEPEDSGIDLSMAGLNKHIAAQNTPSTPTPEAYATNSIQNIPTSLPENHANYPLDTSPNVVLSPPNVVTIPLNEGQLTPNVVNTNPSLGDILTNLPTFGVKNTSNHPNLGVTKNKYTKNTTTNTADSKKSTASPTSKVKSKTRKKSKQTKKQYSKAQRDCANQHAQKNPAQPVAQSDIAPQHEQENPAQSVPPSQEESLLFFSKQKEQDLIANIEEKLDAKMQTYATQISQMNQSIADIVQGLNQVHQSIQTANTQSTSNNSDNSNTDHHHTTQATPAIENTSPTCNNTAVDYQANVEEYNQMQQSAQQEEPIAKPTPTAKSETAKTPAKTTTANNRAKTNLQANNYLSCLTFPANLRYSEQRGMADLLSPIEQNDAQMLLDILADRIENGTDPVNSTVAYLARLLQKYHNDDLDKSRYVSSEEKAQQTAEKAAAQYASDVLSEYEDAVIDHRDMLRNFGYHASGEDMTPMEYFTKRDLKSFWEKIEQRLAAAQAAMEKLNNS